MKIDSESNIKNKEQIKKLKMTTLINKYYDKIVKEVTKNIDKKETAFYYNYYDFTNNKIGKPRGLFNEMMQEMCYEYSEYKKCDEDGNVITLKGLFGNTFNWDHVAKNKVIIKW